MWGDNIVQAIKLETTSPSYSFEANIAPAGAITFTRNEKFNNNRFSFEQCLYTNDLARLFTLKFNNFKEFPHVVESRTILPYKNPADQEILRSPDHHIKGENDNETIENIQKAAELFVRDYLPAFDSVTDFNSYIKWKAEVINNNNLYGGVLFSYMDLLYKAYLDGDCSFGVDYLIQKQQRTALYVLKRCFGDWEKINLAEHYKRNDEFIKEMEEMGVPIGQSLFGPAYVEECLVEAKKEIEENNDYYQRTYKLFWDSVKKGDFSWVENKWEEETAFVLETLKEFIPKLIK